MTRADKPSEPESCLLCADAVARRGFGEWRPGACRHARVTASPNPPYEPERIEITVVACAANRRKAPAFSYLQKHAPPITQDS